MPALEGIGSNAGGCRYVDAPALAHRLQQTPGCLGVSSITALRRRMNSQFDVTVLGYPARMEGTTELRPCPFCAHERPILAELGDESVRFVVVTCPECGAIGPRATSGDAPGTAEHLWNSRYGVQ